MSDGENSASPQKDEKPIEEGGGDQEEKEADESKESVDVEEMEEEEKKVETTPDKVKPKEATSKKSPKKAAKKKKEIPEPEPEDEVDEDDEEQLGLLERPVIIESGKREKRKVERLEMSSQYTPKEKKNIEVPEGIGEKLGDCPRIEHQLQKTKTDDLKTLHRMLYNRVGSVNLIKKNIRLFCGFGFGKDDKEYEKKTATLNKLNLSVLKSLCETLDLERKGTKDNHVSRILEFLMDPRSSGKKVPKPKKKRRSGPGGDNKQGVKRKRKGSDKKEKKEKKQKTKKKAEDSEISDISDDEEEEEENEEEEEKEDEEEKGAGDAEEEEEEEEEEEPEEESEEEAPPPKKKPKVEAPKVKSPPAEEKKVAKKAEKKETKKVEQKETKKEKEKPKVKPEKKEKDKKAASPKKRKAPDGDSSEDDEPLVKKPVDEPPTDDEVKDCIKKILKGANLEEVTMKTVLKQVYETYPDFDLSDRKPFIKNTVKELIS